MKYCVQVVANSSQLLGNAETALRNSLSNKPTWGPYLIASGTEGGVNFLSVEIRFELSSDADAFILDVQNNLDQLVWAGQITRHDCPHDGPSAPCVSSTVVTR